MPKIDISSRDGDYDISVADDWDATIGKRWTAQVEDRVLEAWRRHCDDRAAWNTLWIQLKNEQHEEQELRDLRDRVRVLEAALAAKETP